MRPVVLAVAFLAIFSAAPAFADPPSACAGLSGKALPHLKSPRQKCYDGLSFNIGPGSTIARGTGDPSFPIVVLRGNNLGWTDVDYKAASASGDGALLAAERQPSTPQCLPATCTRLKITLPANVGSVRIVLGLPGRQPIGTVLGVISLGRGSRSTP